MGIREDKHKVTARIVGIPVVNLSDWMVS